MTNESRAAFEAWINPDDRKNYWDCWQASRKVALTEGYSRMNTDYTQKIELMREKQAEALTKKQAVREQIRARRAAKGKS